MIRLGSLTAKNSSHGYVSLFPTMPVVLLSTWLRHGLHVGCFLDHHRKKGGNHFSQYSSKHSLPFDSITLLSPIFMAWQSVSQS